MKVSDMSIPGNARAFTRANNWISRETASLLKVKPIEPGATVFAKIGEALKSERLRIVVRETVIDNNLMAAIPKPTTTPEFLYYLLHVAGLSGLAGGSALPYLRSSDLAKATVLVPSLSEQRRIAGVLGALDNLIDHNRAASVAHAELALALGARFMSGVADRPTRPLADYCTVTKGFSYKSAELVEGADTLVNLKNIGRSGVFERRGFKPLASDRFKPQHVIHPGEVVVAMTDLTQNREVVARPVRVPQATVAGRMVASLDLAVVRPRDGYSREFLTAALSQRNFHDFAKNYSNGTTVLHLSGRVFDDYRVPVVSPEESHEVGDVLRTLYVQQDALMTEIDDLTKTRDELLPLLMSGRVRVRDVEGLVS